MANKNKGSNAERELIKMFSENGWRAVRVAGSGVNDYSPCDLIAGKDDKKISIEAKSTRKDTLYISKEQMNDFVVFSHIIALTPLIAIKFFREGWIFIHPNQMRDTGKNWAIKSEEAKKTGMRFGQLTDFGETEEDI
jgi:holliday junction resolvase Hjr